MKWLILALASSLVLSAQSPPPSRPGVTGHPLELTLEDTLVRLLSRNQDVQAWRLDLQYADLQLAGAHGAYDPVLGFDTRYENRTTAVSSILGGAANGKLDEVDFSTGPALSGLLGSGATYQTSLFLNRQVSSSLFVPFVPQYLSGLALSVEQPLAKGLRIDAARRSIAVANLGRGLAAAQFRERVMSLAAQAAKAYFHVLAAQENLAIQAEALAEARRGIAANQRLVKQGLMAAADVITVQGQAAGFETGYYAALDAWNAAENALKKLIAASKDDPLWQAPLQLTSTLQASVDRLRAADIPVEQAVQEALQKRPESAVLQAATGINEVNSRFFDDQMRPQVNLYANYASNGLAGILADRPNPFGGLGVPGAESAPPHMLGGPGTSLANTFLQRFPSITIGLKIALPLRNRTAAANAAQARIDLARSRNHTGQFQLGVVAEVRNAAHTYTAAVQRLRAASESRKMALADYESQRRKLAAGLTSTFELYQKHTRYVEEQARELQASTDLRISLIEYERTLGRTLDVYRIELSRHTPPPVLPGTR
ncbi:MAG: TolC family protein [Bryobacterales bacterium]|nr:TolC family protein [Bryobacterales bacterium]